MTFQVPQEWQSDIIDSVRSALAEDIKDGDITAELIPETETMRAKVITREDAILCGQAWVIETFKQVDPSVQIEWFAHDGDAVKSDQTLYTLSGNARSLLTGERTALNFLQLLSGTATISKQYADAIAHTNTKVLDTRKTIPGLRTAQKYAVLCGACNNHRIGLYDAFLIKENHISACGSIANAVATANKNHPGKPVEVETENLGEVQQALDAGADRIMLDDFSLEDMCTAVELCGERCDLEASGNVTLDTIATIAETGVDYISSGSLTKHCRAIDLSMRFIN
ncbi:MAG: carboxylating nicotinate-nucleotide diphosphorylase [Pseudomonadota bacterium]